MGLKVIKERVEMAGGEFIVESKSGEGTRVSFQVPDSVLGATERNLA
jgi:signal transduction histidine kinase